MTNRYQDPGDQFDGEKVFFWRERGVAKGGILGAIESLVSNAIDKRGNPQDYIRHDISIEQREVMACILGNGKPMMGYMGYADCRICGLRLGTRDLFGFGFIWPEKAEHYLSHYVWPPGADELLAAYRKHAAALPPEPPVLHLGPGPWRRGKN